MVTSPAHDAVLKGFNYHPRKNENGFEHPYEALTIIRSVPKIDTDLA
jgi:hypothetical protein